MQVYSGSCSELVPSGCYGNESGVISNLTAGVTYYLRVYTYACNAVSGYSLCLRALVANDNCSGAFSFPAIPGDGTCAAATINTTDATGPEGWVCEGRPDDDVWFRFVAPAGVAALSYDITMISRNPGISFQLYSGSCGSHATSCFSTPAGIITGLSGNSVYYLRLYTRAFNAPAVFNLCLLNQLAIEFLDALTRGAKTVKPAPILGLHSIGAFIPRGFSGLSQQHDVVLRGVNRKALTGQRLAMGPSTCNDASYPSGYLDRVGFHWMPRATMC